MTAPALASLPTDRLVVALQRLGLQYSHVREASGASFWHVPFEDNTILTVYIGSETIGVTTVLNGWGGKIPSREEVLAGALDMRTLLALLGENGGLGMAKVSVSNGFVSVGDEFPVDLVSEQLLRVAMTHVLSGVKRIRAIFSGA